MPVQIAALLELNLQIESVLIGGLSFHVKLLKMRIEFIKIPKKD
jgi:hypothetical protein